MVYRRFDHTFIFIYMFIKDIWVNLTYVLFSKIKIKEIKFMFNSYSIFEKKSNLTFT